MESSEESEYRNKLSVCAQSLADKMAVLEARDRLMRLKRMRQTDLATAVAVVGTCPDMCPELERYFRQETNQVSLFEMDGNTGRPDEHRLVKEYRRSGADQEEPLAHELRPTPVLNRTMDYLCTNIMDALDLRTSCGDWYDFVWSRTRSIRKDITQQHLCDEQAVALTEKCARFHIHCSATLCEQNVKDFDPKINEENLSNCLQSLKDLYYDLSLRDIYCCNESEFRCYEILLHLNDTAILKDVQNYRQQIRESRGVQIAIKAFFAYQSNNYIKFFQVLDQCSYLMACILHRYFTPIRQKAFKILRKCYTSNPSSVQEYPSDLLVSCLGFEDLDELKSFCDHIGIECNHQIVYLIRGQNQNNTIKAQRSVRLVENKRIVSVGQVINGSSLPSNPYKSVLVHDSFNNEGTLKTDAIEALDQKTKTIVCSESDIKPISLSPSNGQSVNSFSFSSIGSGFSLPQSLSHIQHSNNIFNVSVLKTRTHLFDSISSDNKINVSDVSHIIYESIAEDVISDVVNDEVLDICRIQLERILNQVKEQSICDLFSDIFLNTSDQMIKEIASDVIQEEEELRLQQMKAIQLLSNNIFENLVASEIKSVSMEVLTKSKEQFIERENILIANQIFNDIIDHICEDIASTYLSNEIQLRDQLIRLIREKRIRNLQTKYFFKWKDWFSRRKRFKYWSQSFPAAPNWGSTKSSSDVLSYSISDSSFEDIFNKSIEKQLLANDLLNYLIDSVIKDIISEVFQSIVSPKPQFFEYFQEKRLKRIQNKYFQNWKQFCAKKRLEVKRSSFPAAPNWTSKESFSSKTKHSFCLSDTDIQISAKRLRRQLTPDSNELSVESDSMANIRPLFETELSESRALTQRIAQQISCDPIVQTINQFNAKHIDDTEEQYVEEDDHNIQVIQVFESETDKINRLKRLIAEEKDYFSLQNFVHYLNENN